MTTQTTNTIMNTQTTRDLQTICREIYQDWGTRVNYAAKPYLQAMNSIHTVQDKHGYDSAHSIISYFLANATSWRGDVARRVKAELNAMLK